MKFKLILCIFIAISFFSCDEETFPLSGSSDQYKQYVNGINSDTLKKYLDQLTGVRSINVNGNVTQILSRHKDSPGNNIAGEFIKSKLQSYGYDPIVHQFSSSGKNIIATLPGSASNIYFLICAHYDSMPAADIAPGADDNGSGTAAVLEIARVLKNTKPELSIIFAFWDEEEQGLIGSGFYAAAADSENKNIRAVLNLDMIGFDRNNDYVFTFMVSSSQYTPKVVEYALDIIDDMNFSLLPTYSYGNTRADHSSFWRYNYSAVTMIEDLLDFNNAYHTQNDNVSNINFPYWTEMTKLAIGIVAKSAL